jgi:hypothetical protein
MLWLRAFCFVSHSGHHVFEALAHYYLATLFVVSFTRHAITRPLFYTPFVLVAVTAIVMRIAAAIRSRSVPALGESR